MSRIAILGAGSWGTALAIVLSRATRPHEIFLWSRDANHAQSISRSKENRKYLPQVNVPAAIRITRIALHQLQGSRTVLGVVDVVVFLILNFSEFMIVGFLAVRSYRRRGALTPHLASSTQGEQSDYEPASA